MENWKKNLYIIWATQILSIAGFGFVLPFLPYFIQEVGVTDPEELNRWVGLINAIAAVGMGIMAPLWGFLADKYGRKLMIVRAVASASILLFAMSYAKTVQGIFILRLLQGIFCGTVSASATLVSAGTPRERLSFALGFLASSTFIGFSFGPLLGGIAAEYLGYRLAFKIGGLLQAGGLVFVLIFVREMRLQEPEPKGVRGDKRNGKANFLILALILGAFFFLRFARMIMPPFVPLHVQNVLGTIDGASAAVGVISSLAALAAAAAGITIVRLADKMNKINLISICLVFGIVFSFPLFLTGGLVSFTVFYVLAMFSIGAVEPILQSYFAERTSANRRGRLFGIQTLIGSMGWFCAPLASSYVSNTFGISYVFLFGCVFIGVTLIYNVFAGWGIRRVSRSAETKESDS